MAGATDGVDGREVLRQQFVADDAAELGAVGVREAQRDRFEFHRPHVFGRRIDQVAHERAGAQQGESLALFDVGAFQRQSRQRLALLEITIETISAQAPTEQGQGRIDRHRRIRGEAISADRQQLRQVRQRQRIVGIADAGDHALGPAVGRRHRQEAAGDAGESVRFEPDARALILRVAPGGKRAAIEHDQRNRLRDIGSGSETGGQAHAVSLCG